MPSELENPACQVCGQPTDGYQVDRDIEEFRPLAPAWPGGPLMEDFGSAPKLRCTGTHIKLTPCGHEQPDPKRLFWVERTKNGA